MKRDSPRRHGEHGGKQKGKMNLKTGWQDEQDKNNFIYPAYPAILF